ncbi:hypothetical protein BsWGS_03389 [Bradybaena similaris]
MAAKGRRRRAKSPAPSPYGPTPMAHVGLLGSRHLHPARLKAEKTDTIVALKLIDTSSNTIDNVQKLSTTIKRLTVSSLGLQAVPERLVSSLIYLTKLDLSDNRLGDTSFPECMKNMEQMVDIRLAKNKLTKFPACFRKLQKLRRLDLGDNQISTINGLTNLRRLRILVLDNNKLTSVFKEVAPLRRLEVLRCCRNSLREISRDLGHLKFLVDLDVSDNKISTIATDVFLLPNLDVFIASKNEISTVPTFIVRPHNKHSVSHIDLSDNRLTKFPAHLLAMADKLDLSGNRIRSLPFYAIKKLDVNTHQTLLLKDNPLTYPPSDICESGLRCIMSFFHETQSQVKVHQGVKVLVLGHHRSGKTSFVNTLIDQQPRMSEDLQETSGGIDIYDMTFDLEEDLEKGMPGKSLELCIWDFCGHAFYMYPHYTFFEHPSVAILTFNMQEYTEATFHDHIGCWVDWMLAKTNRVVIVLVGTHSDQLTVSQMRKVSTEVKASLARHVDRHSQYVKDRIRDIEERPHISPTLSEQLKMYMRLLQTKTIVQTDVVCISSKQYLGFDQVRQSILNLVTDKQLFPRVMRVIPTFWLDVRHYIEDRGNSMNFPVLSWAAFEQEVTSRFGMKHLVKSIAQYLHESGQILWFSSIEKLKDIVFVRPSWLFDLLRCFLRHDLENITFAPEDKIRSKELTTVKFDRLKKDAISEGIFHRDFFRYLLAPLLPIDQASLTTDIMKLLAEGFELGFHVNKPQKEPVFATNTKHESRTMNTLTRIKIPWLIKDPEPDDFKKVWNSLVHRQKLVCCYHFPLYLPPGLFEVICVRAQNEKHNLHILHQWGGGIHAVHLQDKIHVSLSYIQNDLGPNNGMNMVKFEVRDDNSEKDLSTALTIMWAVLVPLLLDFEHLLENYSGVLVERLTECPFCGRASFLGEWMTPKETQILTRRCCEACKQEVDTLYLVQPREQRRVIIKRTISAPSSDISWPSPQPEELTNMELFNLPVSFNEEH